jgi:hypothetical protein
VSEISAHAKTIESVSAKPGRQDECAYMKVERSVDGLGSCHDGLGNDLTPKDTYPTAVTNI